MSLKSLAEIKLMQEGGQILRGIVNQLVAAAKPGLATKELDNLARQLIKEAGALPSFLGYRPAGARQPYPAAICTSINEVIVHGLPGDYQLQEGDLLKIDLGLFYKSFHTDTAVTVGIGRISAEAQKLIEITKESLRRAIAQCRPGNHLGDIGYAVSGYVKRQGFSVAKNLTGHGVGRELHEEPTIFNEGQRGKGIELQPGMVLAIEPMVCVGKGETVQLADEAYAVKDGSLTAHFEETVAITVDGPLVLTK